MPTHDLPPLLWLSAILANAFILVLSLVRNFQAPALPERSNPEKLPRIALVAVVALALVSYFLAPAPDKGQLALGGTLIGGSLTGLLGLGPRVLLWKDVPARDWLARGSATLVLVTLADRSIADPVLLSYALMGYLLGASCVAMPLVLARHERAAAVSASLALVAAIAAAVIWGDRSVPGLSLGSAWSLAVLALSLLVSYACTFLPGAWPVFAACVLVVALGTPWALWSLHLAPTVLMPIGLGLLVALAFAVYVLVTERLNTASSLVDLGLVLLAGGALLLANRLFGMFGVTLAAVGLLPLALAGTRGPSLTGLLLTAFAGRGLLQVFLDRTYLRQYGVDLLHTYTSFGLLASLLIPLGIVALRRRFAPGTFTLGLETLGLLALPLGVGYFIHIDPLASYLAGLLIVTLVLGLAPGTLADREAVGPLLPVLLLSTASLGLLAAPWLIKVLNVPRLTRIEVLAAVLVVVLAYVLGLIRQRPVAAPNG